MARRTASGRWRLRLLGVVVLLALLAGGWGWWQLDHWQPPRAAYPLQGVEVGGEVGEERLVEDERHAQEKQLAPSISVLAVLE